MVTYNSKQPFLVQVWYMDANIYIKRELNPRGSMLQMNIESIEKWIFMKCLLRTQRLTR